MSTKEEITLDMKFINTNINTERAIRQELISDYHTLFMFGRLVYILTIINCPAKMIIRQQAITVNIKFYLSIRTTCM